ncbi:MAG: hypothetical protein EBS53_11080 [Bacteroidetes bacterium]|nr:hypothetical protein [Bacteroidota bacterium]
MKKTSLILFTLLVCPLEKVCLSQNIVFSRTNNSTNNINVPAGETWKVVNWKSDNGWTEVYFESLESGIQFYGNGPNLYSIENPNYPIGAVFVGPALIKASSATTNNTGRYYLVFEKIKNSSVGSNTVSATSVVIPSSATGDVDVKMEQSADNVTWTECLPGTYNSSTVKRFFRLRAVEK